MTAATSSGALAPACWGVAGWLAVSRPLALTGHWLVHTQVKECKRLLKPNGVLLIADNNPRSKVIQNLPPVLFTLVSFAGASCSAAAGQGQWLAAAMQT